MHKRAMKRRVKDKEGSRSDESNDSFDLEEEEEDD